MDERGKVSGSKRVELFSELQQQNTLLTLRLAGKDYERLTMVNEVQATDNGHAILIDPPRGFEVVVKNVEQWKLHFTFNGPDKLEYKFTTIGGEFSGNDIVIPFPEFVERIQRRRFFRMETPIGAKLLFKHNGIQRAIGLINISEGGVYGVLSRLKQEARQKPILKNGESLTNVELELPGDEEGEADRRVRAKRVTVRRIEEDQEKDIHRYAFEIIDITPGDNTKLTQYIYYLQRLFLRRR
jgi:c-di-GMP-binding flagellar brake protein YcgR